MTSTGAERYWDDGYAALPAFVPLPVTRAFLNTLRGDLARGGISLDRLQRSSPLLRREAIELYGGHYPPLNFFLWGLTPSVRRLVGRELLPTYSYFRIYREGDICRVHSDRYACEHSVSLLLASSEGRPWPLDIGTGHIATPRERADADFGSEAYKSVAMKPGDAVLYQGVHRLHGRMTPNPNRWSAHLFLHWVDAAGPYADHAMEGQDLTEVDLVPRS